MMEAQRERPGGSSFMRTWLLEDDTLCRAGFDNNTKHSGVVRGGRPGQSPGK